MDLGSSPLANAFVTEAQLEDPELYYPLRAYVCDRCFLVQLPEVVPPRDVFSEYAYFSSYSESWLRQQSTPPQQPQAAAHQGKHANRARRAKAALGRQLFKGITLSDAEKANVKQVHAKYAPQMKALREQFKPQFQAVRAARQRGDTAALKNLWQQNAPQRAQTAKLLEAEAKDLRSALTPRTRSSSTRTSRSSNSTRRSARRKSGKKFRAALGTDKRQSCVVPRVSESLTCGGHVASSTQTRQRSGASASGRCFALTAAPSDAAIGGKPRPMRRHDRPTVAVPARAPRNRARKIQNETTADVSGGPVTNTRVGIICDLEKGRAPVRRRCVYWMALPP